MKYLVSLGMLLISLFIISPKLTLASEDWRKLESKNFTVVGNASADDMKKVITKLEQFRGTIMERFPSTRAKASMPTTVILFKDDESFHEFKPRYKGKIRDNIGGYCTQRGEMYYIVQPAHIKGAILQSNYELIFHEYFHAILNNNLIHPPTWLNEGLAEFYSTFDLVDGDKKVLIGEPLAARLLLLRKSQLLPIDTLLNVEHNSPLYNEASHTNLFYAQVWALVHYLILGDNGKHLPQLNTFIRQLNSGMSMEENFRESFQTDFKTMGAELQKYIQRAMFPAWKFDFKTDISDKEMTVNSLSEAAANSYMGDLLIPLDQNEADKRLQKAIKLDANYAPGQLVLGTLRMKQRRYHEAVTILQQALALDPKIYNGNLYLGEALMEDRQYDASIKAFQQVIALRPDAVHAYQGIGFTHLAAGQKDEAEQAFQQALRLDPKDQEFYRRRSYIYLLQGEGKLAATDALSYLNQAGWQDSATPYEILKAYFGYQQTQQKDEADKLILEAINHINKDAWPYPVLKYLQHTISAQDLLKQADDNDKQTEAHAYIGLELSLNGKREEALGHFNWVKEKGNKGFTEYALSLAEIERLTAPKAVTAP